MLSLLLLFCRPPPLHTPAQCACCGAAEPAAAVIFTPEPSAQLLWLTTSQKHQRTLPCPAHLHNVHDLLKRGHAHVPPADVVDPNLCCHEGLRVVGEPADSQVAGPAALMLPNLCIACMQAAASLQVGRAVRQALQLLGLSSCTCRGVHHVRSERWSLVRAAHIQDAFAMQQVCKPAVLFVDSRAAQLLLR